MTFAPCRMTLSMEIDSPYIPTFGKICLQWACNLMWALLTLATAHLTPFNPILYKRLADHAGAVVTIWAVKGWASPLLALLVARLRVGTPTRDKLVIHRTSLAKLF